MRVLIIILILIVSTGQLMGQDVDTATVPDPPHAGKISNVVFQFDNRTERYNTVRGRMNGLKLGLEFRKRIRAGFGFYGNNTRYLLTDPKVDTVNQLGRFQYTTFFGELVFYRSFRWEFSAAAALGRGLIDVDKYAVNSINQAFIGSERTRRVGVRDIALNGHYKIWPWFGLGVGMGYRWVSNVENALLNDAYRDVYFDFKLKIFFGYVVKGIFKPEAIEKERAYYDWRKKKRHAAFKALFTND